MVAGFRLLEEGVHNTGASVALPQVMGGIVNDVQCEETTAATTVKHVEREREK